MAFDIINYQLFLRTKTRSLGVPQRSINSSSQDEILQLWRISGAAITPGRASVVMTEPVDPQTAFLPIMIASNHVQCKWAQSSVGLRSPTVLRLVYFWTLWTISRGSCPAHVGRCPLPRSCWTGINGIGSVRSHDNREVLRAANPWGLTFRCWAVHSS